MYLEDVDLALRLRLAGWGCRYEPVVARHASEGSSRRLSRGLAYWVARNDLLLVAKAFPLRWAPLVLYRQAGYAWHAAREGRLRAHLSGLAAALPLLPAMLARATAVCARRPWSRSRTAVPRAPHPRTARARAPALGGSDATPRGGARGSGCGPRGALTATGPSLATWCARMPGYWP